MFYKKTLGQEGEKIAIKYLQRLGYTIIEQNFRCKSGEIDAVNRIKQKHIVLTASYYVFLNHLNESNIRFDVIEVLKKDKIYVRHIRNCEMLALV